MTTIEAVSTHIPENVVNIDGYLAGLGIADQQIDFYGRIFGNARVRRDPQARAVDQLLAAASGLESLRGNESRVRYCVHARTIQITPHGHNALLDVRDKLGLSRAEVLSVSQQACASGLLALDVVGRLLDADDDPDALALLFAGEKTFSPITKVMGAAVLGEGVAAVLVGRDGPGDRVLGYASRTHGEFNDPLGTPPELQPRFNELYPVALTDVVTRALDSAGLTPADVALVLPHNVNRTGWSKVSRSLGLPQERVFLDNLAELGHCFSADSFLNYHTARSRGLLTPGDHYVMTGIGGGATWAATVLRCEGGRAEPAAS